MRISRTSASLGALAIMLLGAGIPALGQDKPESLLPPGFNEPVTTPAPAPPPRPRPTTPATTQVPRPTASGVVAVPTSGATDVPDAPVAEATPAPVDPTLPQVTTSVRYEMPDYARRSLASVGAAGPAEGALGPTAFRGADGIYLEALMRYLDAPVASRWLSIGLRRALMARIDTPARVNGADFAAERAWLLVRMGESVAARAVVQSVDSDNYTPKLYQAAMQAALATGDPGALCSLADQGAKVARERAWLLAPAICAGLAGLPAKSTPALNAAEKAGVARGIDILLAKKVAGTGSRGRQAITIEWDAVSQLTAFRYGLATATGTEIPDSLLKTAAPHVQAWRALSPMLDTRSRIAPADYAAARGVLSNAALVDLYGALDAEDDQSIAEIGVARDLRTAYNGATRAERMAALRTLWDEPKTADGRFARLILTARAVARLPVDTVEADVDRVVASMLTAGLDSFAQRWRSRAERGSDAWAMLVLAETDSGTGYSYGDVSGYAGKNDGTGLKRRMFFAGMAGLGKISAAEAESGARSLDVPIGNENGWTRAIDRAARQNQPGLVLLLAAIGMQTSDWHGVPPEVLFRTVSALRAVGLTGEARMIAAEAIARL
ncbi:hypothetical protein H3Z74_09930 [Sphingomonas alpina]|uniref:Uncharacterized protein n=1 Tax=Sphingomonas alpina TaxID=653931 RepID=A0A7H0LP20_9SPHN|nr:hypothetical protein H3Z74_09930 [Sphingomonas alpina]